MAAAPSQASRAESAMVIFFLSVGEGRKKQGGERKGRSQGAETTKEREAKMRREDGRKKDSQAARSPPFSVRSCQIWASLTSGSLKGGRERKAKSPQT